MEELPSTMEEVRKFLESSSIHGLARISTDKKYGRLFWIFVVFFGFCGTVVLINQSFQNWENNPVTTTIETLPIKDITFPKVTVCPPKDTFTDLNYDLQETKSLMIDIATRQELAAYATELLQNKVHDRIMVNLRKLEDDDKYFNWYNGYSEITLPTNQNGITFQKVNTYATSGSMSTQYYGEKFDEKKLQQHLAYENTVFIKIPPSSWSNKNVTLHFKIETVPTPESEYELFWVHYIATSPEQGQIFKNFTAPSRWKLMRQDQLGIQNP